MINKLNDHGMYSKIDAFGRDCGSDPTPSRNYKFRQAHGIEIDVLGHIYVKQPNTFTIDNDKVLEIFVVGERLSVRYYDDGRIKYIACPGVTYYFDYSSFNVKIVDMDVY